MAFLKSSSTPRNRLPSSLALIAIPALENAKGVLEVCWCVCSAGPLHAGLCGDRHPLLGPLAKHCFALLCVLRCDLDSPDPLKTLPRSGRSRQVRKLRFIPLTADCQIACSNQKVEASCSAPLRGVEAPKK